jgi:acetyl esterase/lipase
MNAAVLGIDPDRIVASGGSSGGTCTALTALSGEF